ncbi:DUF6643 family protein [Streptomyces sp. TP-A0874]|uniref:DUF6643 family protein n=1 Tax=Streptomyces sp. TP-A0874 TaxID=549819 RepID=UPI000853C707|nr:DUF6643 family protein [Streptomyces sp. TP-A0874]
MTPPRSTYGGGYYSAPSFPDTPIYDSLVAERGTPQIAPIRVPAAPYDTGSHLPALPAALPALPAAPSHHTPPHGYQHQTNAVPPPAPLQQAPAPHIPQRPVPPRGYPVPQQPQPGHAPAGGMGYEAMRPAAPRPQPPRPAPAPPVYDDPYGRQYPRQGY